VTGFSASFCRWRRAVPCYILGRVRREKAARGRTRLVRSFQIHEFNFHSDICTPTQHALKEKRTLWWRTILSNFSTTTHTLILLLQTWSSLVTLSTFHQTHISYHRQIYNYLYHGMIRPPRYVQPTFCFDFVPLKIHHQTKKKSFLLIIYDVLFEKCSVFHLSYKKILHIILFVMYTVVYTYVLLASLIRKY